MVEGRGNSRALISSRFAFMGNILFKVILTMTDGLKMPMHKVNLVMKSTRALEEHVSGVMVHLFTDGKFVYMNNSFIKIGYHGYAMDSSWKVTECYVSGNTTTDLRTFMKFLLDFDDWKNPLGTVYLMFDEHVEGKLQLKASFELDGPEPAKRICLDLTLGATWIPAELFPVRAANPQRARMSSEELAEALRNDFWNC